MSYKIEYTIKSTQVGQDRKLNIRSLLNVSQDLCTDAMEATEFNRTATMDRGYLWIILRTYIIINDLPTFTEKVNLKTFTNDIKKFIYPRYVVCDDTNGNNYFSISSYWALLNEKTRKISFPEENGINLPADKDEKFLPNPPSIAKIDTNVIGKRKVCYSDIDLNGHVNNIRYLDYVFDCLGSDYFKERQIKEIILEYNSELKENDEIEIRASSFTSPQLFEIISGDKKCFSCEIIYK